MRQTTKVGRNSPRGSRAIFVRLLDHRQYRPDHQGYHGGVGRQRPCLPAGRRRPARGGDAAGGDRRVPHVRPGLHGDQAHLGAGHAARLPCHGLVGGSPTGSSSATGWSRVSAWGSCTRAGLERGQAYVADAGRRGTAVRPLGRLADNSTFADSHFMRPTVVTDAPGGDALLVVEGQFFPLSRPRAIATWMTRWRTPTRPFLGSAVWSGRATQTAQPRSPRVSSRGRCSSTFTKRTALTVARLTAG